MPHRALLLALGALLLGVAGVPLPGLAHPAPSTTPAPVSGLELRAADRRAESSWSSARALTAQAVALAGAGLALGLTLLPRGRRGRHLAVLGLVLLLTLVAFEGSVHSVHHLGDPYGADRCLVAVLAAGLSAAGAERPPFAVLALPPLGPAPVEPPLVAGRVSLADAAGRAPPA